MGKSVHPAKEIVRRRSEGMCERCGIELTRNVNGVPDGDSARSIHHRQPKRVGGKDSVVNLVNLCIGCHREIHEDEKKAALEGWIVLDRYPGKIPFLSWRGWLIPDKEGGLALLDWETGRQRMLTEPPPITTRRKRVATKSRTGYRKSRRNLRVA